MSSESMSLKSVERHESHAVKVTLKKFPGDPSTPPSVQHAGLSSDGPGPPTRSWVKRKMKQLAWSGIFWDKHPLNLKTLRISTAVRDEGPGDS